MSVDFSRLRTASIGNQLLLLALGTLLPVVLFAAGLAVFQANQERQMFERGMHARVVGITSAIDAELRATVAALRTLAESQSLADGELPRFHGQALRVKNLHPDWVTVFLAGPDGLNKVNAIVPYGADPLRVDETASFEVVQRTLQPTSGSLSSGPRAKRPAFPVRVPVLQNGQLASVVSGLIRAETPQRHC